MAKLTIIVGMAGSGKSHFCEEYAKQHSAKAFFDGTLANKDEKRAGFNCLGEIVACLLGRNEDCVMDESHLCMKPFRDNFKAFCDEFLPEIEQEWIFFEKNTLASINNIFHDFQEGRQSPSRLEALLGQNNGYTVPARDEFPGEREPVPAYQRPSPRFTDEGEALKWVQDTFQKLMAVGKQSNPSA